MPRTTLPEYLADYFASIGPDVWRRLDERRNEYVQTGVWLVGLASALLALFVANREKVAFLSRGEGRVIVTLLGATVLFGLMQRIAFLFASVLEFGARLRFLAWLRAYRGNIDTAVPLDESWTKEAIVERLIKHYDLDYSSLLQSPSALDDLKRIYAQTHANGERSDQDQLRRLFREMGRWAGWTEAEVRTRVEGLRRGNEDDKLSRLNHRAFFIVGSVSLVAGSLTFAAAVVIFCIGFLTG